MNPELQWEGNLVLFSGKGISSEHLSVDSGYKIDGGQDTGSPTSNLTVEVDNHEVSCSFPKGLVSKCLLIQANLKNTTSLLNLTIPSFFSYSCFSRISKTPHLTDLSMFEGVMPPPPHGGAV